jgi:putative membrane protein
MTAVRAVLRTHPGLRGNPFLQVVAVGYALFWIAMAIKPHHFNDWLLENLLVFLAAAAMLATYRRFQFSNLSYLLMGIFMVMHAYGAHYTYAEAPFDLPLNDWIQAGRNNFDRLVHFSYGLLLLYPTREFFIRKTGLSGGWGSFFAATFIAATGGFFEIIEMWAALVVAPDLGEAYLGTQGDQWDAHKDIVLAIYGAIVTVGLVPLIQRLVGKEAAAPASK